VDEEIFVMERDGSNPLRLTNDADADAEPQWTPDGRIAFITCPSSQDALPNCRLDSISPDGSGRETVMEGFGFAFGATLSPGGDKLAYSRYDETLRPLGIFVQTIGLKEAEPVGDGAGAQWSPDGERIAFLSDRDLERARPRSAEEAAELRLDEAHPLVHRLERRLGGLARLLGPARE
jgi:TolB protein